MKVGCSICSELTGKADPYLGSSYKKLVESGNNILLNGENFVVLPSIGALNPSHVLVVPRDHVCSFAMLSQEQLINELPLIYLALKNINLSNGVKTVFFEHGMGLISDTSGACVSHAHLHVISNVESLELKLQNSISFVNIHTFALISYLASKEEGYIVFGNSLGKVGIANRPNLPSQFFRRVYANAAGKPSTWNWRIDRQPLYTSQVVEYYASLKAAYSKLVGQVKEKVH